MLRQEIHRVNFPNEYLSFTGFSPNLISRDVIVVYLCEISILFQSTRSLCRWLKLLFVPELEHLASKRTKHI